MALPKIGDKGLFTKELEDALKDGRIDLVVHSLKDMPCQTLDDCFVISGVPEREDESDALVMAKRWEGIKFTIDDLEENSVIGTSSLRRISQLKQKYPKLKFETIRGNLQTRFAKLDDEKEKKFDAIILATAGLKRMNFQDRITQILPPETCLHAVSQGALGIECRKNDLFVVKMINELNHEETLLRCIAERTFLATLEGGCSAPVGVNSKVTSKSIFLEGVVLDLDGTRRIQDSFELAFDSSLDNCCPVLGVINKSNENSLEPTENKSTNGQKRSLSVSNDDDDESSSNTSSKKLKSSKVDNQTQSELPSDDNNYINNHYSFIMDLKINQNKMMIAELCGLHLAEKLKERGAADLVEEVKALVHASATAKAQ